MKSIQFFLYCNILPQVIEQSLFLLKCYCGGVAAGAAITDAVDAAVEMLALFRLSYRQFIVVKVDEFSLVCYLLLVDHLGSNVRLD